MRIVSKPGIQALIQEEGCEFNVYNDGYGFKTIGIGHKLTKGELMSGKIKLGSTFIRYKDGLTQEQCISLMHQDLYPASDAVFHLVKVPLTDCQFDALVMFTYNVGVTAFGESTLLKLLNQGRYDLVPEQLRRWVYSNGKKSKGLKNRREREIAIWWGQYESL